MLHLIQYRQSRALCKTRISEGGVSFNGSVQLLLFRNNRFTNPAGGKKGNSVAPMLRNSCDWDELLIRLGRRDINSVPQ
jgi:hypothetical protein